MRGLSGDPAGHGVLAALQACTAFVVGTGFGKSLSATGQGTAASPASGALVRLLREAVSDTTRHRWSAIVEPYFPSCEPVLRSLVPDRSIQRV